jgi:hypothetical protein
LNIIDRLVADADQKRKQLQQSMVGHAVQHAAAAVNRDVVQPAVQHAAAPTYNFVANGGLIGQHSPGYATFSRSMTHGLERSAVGTAQAASGLYDLAGGQHGTNRFDKVLETAGHGIDTISKQQHDNPLVYHGSQAAGDAMQLAFGGGEVKAAGRAATELPKAGSAFRFLGKAAGLTEKPAEMIRDATKGGNVVQRTAGRAMGNIVSPKYQAVNAAFTAGQEGKSASHGDKVQWNGPIEHMNVKGHDIPIASGVIPDLLTGGVAFPAGGALAHEALPLLESGAKQTARGAKAAAQHEIKATAEVNQKLLHNSGIDKDIRQAQKEIKGHQESINGIDLTTDQGQRAHEQYLRKIDRAEAYIKTRKGEKLKLSPTERIRANGVGMSVGGPNALSYTRAAKEGRTFTGPDGKPRFEIDDSKSTAAMPKQNVLQRILSGEKPLTMGDLLQHDRLYQDYPQLQ